MIKTIIENRSYQIALEMLNSSSDPMIEALRMSAIEGNLPENGVKGEDLAYLGKGSNDWGEFVLDDMIDNGFIVKVKRTCLWADFGVEAVRGNIARLFAFESAAIVRTQAMSMNYSENEFHFRLDKLAKEASSQSRLGFALALQKLMLSIVTSINETKLLDEYVERISLAMVYAYSNLLDKDFLDHYLDKARKGIDHIERGEGFAAAQYFSDIRTMAFTGM